MSDEPFFCLIEVMWVFGMCSGCLRDVFGMCSGCVRDVFGMCSGEIGFTCDRGLYAPDSLRKSSAPELC